MKKISWIMVCYIILMTGQTLALEITSIVPARGTPGTLVAISGGPFSQQTQPFLGEHYVAPRITSQNHMEFTVPNLPPGIYTLTAKDNTMVAEQKYKFEVMAKTPQITNINPRILNVCPVDSRKQLQINGHNFLPGAVSLMSESTIPSRVISSTLIETQMPELQQPGVYGISVRNPDGATSLPHSLWVNSTPEIHNVERGADFVNYYEVIIHGKNFLFNSTLVVNEAEGRTTSRLMNNEDVDTLSPQNRLIYVDCQTLIYHRYPSSFQNKDLELQVFNPDGRKTDLHYVTLP